MQVSGTGAGGSTAASSDGTSDALRGLDIDQFLQLMVAELQNQDPLSPMENSQILQQVSQMREITATNGLNDTLESLLLGQNVSNASSLIGKNIRGLTDASAGEDAENQVYTEGVVERVTIADGVPKLHVNGNKVSLNNVAEILPGSE